MQPSDAWDVILRLDRADVHVCHVNAVLEVAGERTAAAQTHLNAHARRSQCEQAGPAACLQIPGTQNVACSTVG